MIKKSNSPTVKEYGNIQLVKEISKDLFSILNQHIYGGEIYAMALTRVFNYVPLKRIQKIWEKFDIDINPNLNPKTLSNILKEIGKDGELQDFVFHSLMKDNLYIYDLTSVFTKSSLSFAEIRYNKDKIYTPQINLALLYSTDGLPAMVRVIPGSVKDISSLYIQSKR